MRSVESDSVESTYSEGLVRPIYVVIACAGETPALESVLTSLVRSTIPAAFSGVFVIENGGKGDAESICLHDSFRGLGIRYFHVTSRGKSRALNFALTMVPGNALIIFSDDDVEFAPDCIVEYDNHSSYFGRGHYFGGPVGRSAGAPVPADFLLTLAPRSVMGWSPDPMADNFLFLGCNWACFAVDLEEAGRFDENFGPGSRFGALGQETRMQVALRETGVKPVFVKEAIVNHSPHEDCVRVRWLLLRRYREGIHKGLMYPRRYAKQTDSYCLNKRVEVLRPVPLRGRWHIYGFFLTRLTAQLMEIAGIIKGRCVRILLIR